MTEYFCFVKRDPLFKWGALYPDAKPHIEKRFRSYEAAEAYLAGVPEHIRAHLRVTRGLTL